MPTTTDHMLSRREVLRTLAWISAGLAGSACVPAELVFNASPAPHKRDPNIVEPILRLFVETVDHAISDASERTRSQVSGVRQHASRTVDAIRPSLESAAEAAASNPLSLISESASAAGKLTREAAGSLFGVVGDMLKGAGDRLKEPDRGERRK